MDGKRTSDRGADRNVRRITIRSTVAVIFTSLSDFTLCGLRIASSNVSSSARACEKGMDTSSSAEIATVYSTKITVITIFRGRRARSSFLVTR